MRKTVLHEKYNRWFLHPAHIFELKNENNIWQFKSPVICKLVISCDDPDNIIDNNP